jgi:hypothetical protein
MMRLAENVSASQSCTQDALPQPQVLSKEFAMKRSLMTLLAASLAFAPIVEAEAPLQPKPIVVIRPGDLPQAAQGAGQSAKLYELTTGETYLYIEQQQMGRLAILDVTDPAHIKVVGMAPMELPEAFDFAAQISSSVFLVSFRDGKGSGVMDLRDPRRPVLKSIPDFLVSDDTQRIGRFRALVAGSSAGIAAPEAEEYRLMDLSNPLNPRLIEVVRDVQTVVQKDDTGTTFLLGAKGLTVIRQPVIERQQELESRYANN